ncbi:MAG: prepilin-type N-terminal cleavage/methylation domain-containing protein [Acidobacteria bacterium]|nr:prepilin-type N-terminal cleavage/methylation domain-containing protein [Acidobacteriota bacterium]
MQSHAEDAPHAQRPGSAVKGDERGFTLIETVIALLVMMVATLAAASLFIYAIKYNSGAYSRSLAAAVAQRQLEKLRKSEFSEVVTSTESNVESANRHFSVATTVTGTTLKRITVTVTPRGSGWASTPVVIISQRSATVTGAYF